MQCVILAVLTNLLFLSLSGNLSSTNIRIDPNLTKGIGVDDLRRLCILRLSFVKVPPGSCPPHTFTPSHLMLSQFPHSHPLTHFFTPSL